MADPYTEFQKPVADPYAEFQKPQPSAASAPGILDREIPLTSYGNATLSGMQSIGRGVRAAVQGIGQTFNPVRQPGENLLTQTPIARIGRGLWQTGKQALEVPGAIRDINASPDPLGNYAHAAQETAGQGAGQAITALGSEGLARSVPALARPISNRMYQSALKPPPSLGAAGARPLVETGLQEGVPVSEGGLAKLGNLREATDQAIADTIAKAPTKTINKYAVAKRLGGTEKTFSNQVNPTSDLEAIRQSKGEFLRSQPGEIPGPEAQALKQGTYRSLGKKYGELKGASIESQKALARGLKEELANQYPELKALNAKDSRLIQLDNALERAVARSANREPFGLGGPIAYGVTKAATGSSSLGLVAGFLKVALRNPAVKSRLAIALNGAGRAIGRPGLGASVGGISPLGGDHTTQP